MLAARFLAAGAAVALTLGLTPVRADTTDVKAWEVVRVEKRGRHCADDRNCMNRLHPAIRPIQRARPGQHILFETRDALDSDFDMNSGPEDVTAADLNLVHPLTGPVHIEGAQRGDVLAVTLVDIEPDEYGYTVIVPGFGFLRDRYTEPYIANWKLTRVEAVSDQIPGVEAGQEQRRPDHHLLHVHVAAVLARRDRAQALVLMAAVGAADIGRQRASRLRCQLAVLRTANDRRLMGKMAESGSKAVARLCETRNRRRIASRLRVSE